MPSIEGRKEEEEEGRWGWRSSLDWTMRFRMAIRAVLLLR